VKRELDDDQLKKILQLWKVQPQIPADFAKTIWDRIAERKTSSATRPNKWSFLDANGEIAKLQQPAVKGAAEHPCSQEDLHQLHFASGAKILGFVTEPGERPDEIFRFSLVFIVGILTWCALLALAVIGLRRAGTQVGWEFRFQDYHYLLLLACLVFAFALNLFGVYQFAVPARGTAVFVKLARGKGYGRVFLRGIFAAVLGTSYCAPFLGTVFAFALAQSSWMTFLLFLFIGLGMAIPYLVRALNPPWIRYLPKLDSWMVRLKHLTGFLTLTVLLWLVWIAGQLRGVGGIVFLGALLLIIAILSWIKGAFLTPLASPTTRSYALGAMFLVVLAAYGSYAFITEPSKLSWQNFSREVLGQALASGRSVFIDFTADWCLTCKSNERFAIDTAPVREAFRKKNVILLRADWTHADPVITEVLREHGRPGVPMYLYYPGGKDRPPVMLPELLTPKTIIDVLNSSPDSARWPKRSALPVLPPGRGWAGVYRPSHEG
jgi:thiol:disulfide interchange protein DsbD